MLVSIIPLKLLLWQILFLLIQTTVESLFFHYYFNLSRKASLEYSIPMNLFSTLMGWIIFLLFVPLADPIFQIQIMNFIIFNRLTFTAIFLITIMILSLFILGLVLKIIMFIFLEKLPERIAVPLIAQKRKIFFRQKLHTKKYRFIIWGHFCSHGLILLVLILVKLTSP